MAIYSMTKSLSNMAVVIVSVVIVSVKIIAVIIIAAIKKKSIINFGWK